MSGKRTKPQRKDDTAPSRLDQIARRAYEIYLARGGTDGRAPEDWLQAEREIDAAAPQARTPNSPARSACAWRRRDPARFTC